MSGRPPNPAKATEDIRIPAPPRHLSETARREWTRACRELKRLKILDRADRAIMALYCQAWSRLIEAEDHLEEEGIMIITKKKPTPKKGKKGKPAPPAPEIQTQQPNQWLWISNKASEQVNRFAQQLGLTPVARARLSARDEDDDEGSLETPV